jgi:hypothetical protein
VTMVRNQVLNKANTVDKDNEQITAVLAQQ